MDSPLEHGESDAPVLAEGMIAKVYLLTGETLRGEVVGFDSEVLTIGRVGNYGFTKETIPFSDVERVEVESIAKEMAVPARVGGVVLMILAGLLVLVMAGCAVGDCEFHAD